MISENQVAEEIVTWVKTKYPEVFPNFYSPWEEFKKELQVSFLTGSEISLLSGAVKEITRFTRDGSVQEDPIYFTVVFSVNDEFFKVDGYYDGWNGEPEDLPVVEKINYLV